MSSADGTDQMRHSSPQYPADGKRQRGFTLVEAMIVVALLAILATIAYPSYRDHLLRARRADAKALLLDAQARQESYYFANNKYTKRALKLGYFKLQSPEGYYMLKIAKADADSYEIAAMPAPPHDDPRCGILVLNHLGERSIRTLDPNATAEDCWRR